MKANDYQKTAMKTEANQEAIATRIKLMHPEELVMYVELNNGITGLTDEVGELNAALKKWIEYGQPLNEVNVKEEVGDCLWRLSQICKSVDLTLGECMEANIKKLQDKQTGRYKDGYSDEAAKEESRDREEEAELIESQQTMKKVFGKDKLDEVMIQNGNGWREPPEEADEITQEDIDSVNLQLEVCTWDRGLAIGAQIATEVADLMDGSYDEARKLIDMRIKHAKANPMAEPKND